ncbi:cellulose biosynthesis protein BcsG [Paraburkholderia denitrificans]|uniref:Cellulose biosynthesis protein BcsG n=1 Tax=Paraburkholderia denitrificans TaxID=694025 RepID=A0ABW0J9I2_9BURK
MLATFTPSYMLELAGRVISPSMIAAVVAAVLAYIVLNRWIRVTTFVLIALIVAPLWQGIGTLIAHATSSTSLADTVDNGNNNRNATRDERSGSYDQQLAAFRSNEQGRHVGFTALTSEPADAAMT